MDVDATEPRNIEHRLRQDQTVGDNDHDIGFERRQMLDLRGIAQLQRLLDVQSMLQRALLHRAHRELLAAPGWPIRLCVDGHDSMLGGNQRFERWHREIGCTGKDDRKGDSHTLRAIE